MHASLPKLELTYIKDQRYIRAMVSTNINLLLLMLIGLFSKMEAQQLQVGFYENKCSVAESIVNEEVQKAFANDKGIAPGLIRLHFHDCFVRGCDGSILIDSTPNNAAEKDGPPNGITLRDFEVIDSAKARIEARCKGEVSCADILAFAARDATVITRGLSWDVPAGRRDGRVSVAAETIDIPPPSFSLDQINESFAKKGLTQADMVTLVGVHTIGQSHCSSLSNRLYNFSTATSQDPSLNAAYAAQLKKQCPIGAEGGVVDPNMVVAMNSSPDLMDSSYYRDVLAHRGLFSSDQILTTTSTTAAQVSLYAISGLIWQSDFARAMKKMSQIGVLTGTAGEIRANCRVNNP